MRLFLSEDASCAVCSQPTSGDAVCKKCGHERFELPLRNLEKNRCSVCGKQLVSTFDKCLRCRQEPVLVHTDRMLPLYSYRLWNKTLLFEWKIKGNRSLSAFFARQMCSALKVLNVQVIVPVPPRKGKIRSKGWDQIDELARFLKWRYGFKILEILERLTVQEQKKLSRNERLEHINNAYALCKPKKMERILKPFLGKIPEEVCLIDDVSTTGSTIESCAAVLKSAGVKKVLAVTLFTVD